MLTLLSALALQGGAPPTPPQLPPITHERSVHADALIKISRQATAIVEAYERDVERWMERESQLRAHLEALAARDWTDAVGEKADGVIEDIETIARHRAVIVARLRKKAARDVKTLFKVDAAAAALLRQMAERLARADERAIEVYLEAADFLRALRADMAADRGDARTFDDPAEMAAFLRQSLGV